MQLENADRHLPNVLQIGETSLFFSISLKATIKSLSLVFVVFLRVCQKKIACSSQCGEGSKARCLYDCGYLDKDTPYGPWVDCLTISGCFKTSVFGQCIGEDRDADQSITSISELNGIWWNVKGKSSWV